MNNPLSLIVAQLRNRLTGRAGGRRTERAAGPITLADIHYCYRLFLQRAPDRAEEAYWRERVQSGDLTLAVLSDEFANSGEFLALQQRSRQVERLDLGAFQIFLRPSDFSFGAHLLQHGTYEEAVARHLQAILQPGDTFIDIGANIGYFTLMAAGIVGNSGRVIAFEPNILNCELLQRSIAYNGFQNVDLRPFAVAERAQVFILDTAGSGSNGRIIDATPDAVPGNTPPRIIQAVSLDEALPDLPRLACIKIDVEGAEARALRGMERTIRKHRPVILTEFSPFLLQLTSHVAPEAFLAQFGALNYALSIAGDASGVKTPQEILARHAQSGSSHLDLVATPLAP